MKVFISILALLLVTAIHAQQHQLPFPDSNAVWIQHRDQPIGDPWENISVLCDYKLFSHDTTHLNGEIYNNLYFDYYYDPFLNFEMMMNEFYDPDQIGLFRTDSLKVFYKPLPSTIGYPCYYIGDPFDDNDPLAEILLYDFGISIGDTFDVQIDQQIVLQTIDSIEIDGTYYRKFNFDQINWYSGGDYFWIEGIGSQLGFFAYFNGFETSIHLECFLEDPDSTLINPTFSYSQYGSCDFLGQDEVQEVSDKIYPNPASESINIALTEGQKISILSIRGQKLYETLGNPGLNQIDITNLPVGLYFVQIEETTYPILVD